MRVTTKGQVTIPKDVRTKLGISAGSEVEFVERADGVVELVHPEKNPGQDTVLLRKLNDWFQRIEGTGDSGLLADDIMAMTRDQDARHDR
jgi:AbrB family looped-hinge helix DNA binding protein